MNAPLPQRAQEFLDDDTETFTKRTLLELCEELAENYLCLVAYLALRTRYQK